jgi:hypothetical protein
VGSVKQYELEISGLKYDINQITKHLTRMRKYGRPLDVAAVEVLMVERRSLRKQLWGLTGGAR